jgi:hypothetical protein
MLPPMPTADLLALGLATLALGGLLGWRLGAWL